MVANRALVNDYDNYCGRVGHNLESMSAELEAFSH
jgi:hypothetical protein